MPTTAKITNTKKSAGSPVPTKLRPASQATKKRATQKTGAKSTVPASRKYNKGDICFIISPFGDWYDSYYEDIFCPAAREVGLDPHRADDLYRPSAIVHDIWTYVNSAKVMIADLTGKNANVFYELGLAHALGKPVILLTQDISDIPFDLRSLRIIEYTLDHPSWGDLLKGRIKAALLEILVAPSSAVLLPFNQFKAQKVDASDDELRYVQLSRELATLRNQVLALQSGSPIRRNVNLPPPSEVEGMMRSWLSDGIPASQVMRRITEMGVPRRFVEETLDRVMAEPTKANIGEARTPPTTAAPRRRLT